MKTLIIGVDHGNRMIKTKNDMYSCGYIKTKTQPVGFENVLEFEGNFYCIDGRSKYKYDKTIDSTYFLLTLPAISSRMEEENVDEADVILGIGLPLSHYRLKDNYINYFKKENIRFKYNNKRYLVNIKEVMCFPQAISGLMPFYIKYKDIDFLNLIDVGQVTVDAVKIFKGKPILDSAVSLNYGMMKLVKSIQEDVRKETGIEIDEVQIELSLQGRKAVYFNESIENIIENTKLKFINDLFDELKENGFELQATMNLLMGGGASIIQNSLDSRENSRIAYFEVLPQAQNANAIGYELMVNEAIRRR
jgi:plasmid segregation protein ParM